MSAPKLGTITIGQAPRADVTPTLDLHVPAGVERVHVGVLDRLSDADIASHFAPRPREQKMVTRLLDGRAVDVDARAVEAGVQRKLLELEDAGCTVVVKPAVSAGSYKTARYEAWNEAAAQHARELHAEEDVMIQPYFANIEKYGERSLIFLDGQYSHAVRRHLPLLEGPEVDYLMEPVQASAAELEAAERILAYLPFPDLLYARVDLIPDPENRPRLLELELIEPQLFLREHPPGAPVLARAFARRLHKLQSSVESI